MIRNWTAVCALHFACLPEQLYVDSMPTPIVLIHKFRTTSYVLSNRPFLPEALAAWPAWRLPEDRLSGFGASLRDCSCKTAMRW